MVREDLLSLVGVLFDVAERPVPGQDLTVWMNGQFLTNVTTDAEGSFSILYPVPLDMDLGTQTVEVRFAGAPLYLPSTSSTSFEVFVLVETQRQPQLSSFPTRNHHNS